ncbi:hypothetical protein [Vibrio furnissii]|uniref:hypothetical protein n=1 Tax=Vibrio furnissii TaxID=29494 RepID=UPI003AA92678
MSIKLPSRYEDLDTAYRGRLEPNQDLIKVVDKASKAMRISKGIRFLPLYGESGSGKSSASRELSTHMPDVVCSILEPSEIESREALARKIKKFHERNPRKLLVCVVDQYEENVAGKEKIPTQFVEHLSLLDRGELRDIPVVFIWLTTSIGFRDMLVEATSRNKRILIDANFNILGPRKDDWPKIIEETFSFHNSENSLSDYELINNDLVEISHESSTIGEAIEKVGERLGEKIEGLQNISEYQVVLLWPVSDGLRNQRVLQFSKARDGYKLNWDAWYTELNNDDRKTLPLHEFNRTRLYFDFRIIPIRAADLHKLCLDLNNDNKTLTETYIRRFKKTHFYHVISDNWSNYEYSPVRERESKRSEEAKVWYPTVTNSSVALGKRIAKILTECGLDANYEYDIKTEHSTVRSDIYVSTNDEIKPRKIIELKAYSAENTMPSTIKDQIKITLRKHAQLAGFISRQ